MTAADTFTAAKAIKRGLEESERAAAKRLLGIAGVGSGAMGLTPDSVKSSPEYRTAKAEHDLAFRRLQAFNAQFVKAFAAELRAERRASR